MTLTQARFIMMFMATCIGVTFGINAVEASVEGRIYMQMVNNIGCSFWLYNVLAFYRMKWNLRNEMIPVTDKAKETFNEFIKN
jgi:hypothetical protein